MLEFANYTEVTTVAKEIDVDFFGQYEKVFVCPDVHTVWVSKILIGYDKDYNQNKNSVLIERNNIDLYSAKDMKRFNEKLFIKKVLEAEADDGCNWDILQCESVDEAIGMLKDGFKIYMEKDK